MRRYNAEDKGSFVRNDALVSDLPGIPELKKTNKAGVHFLRPRNCSSGHLSALLSYLPRRRHLVGTIKSVVQAQPCDSDTVVLMCEASWCVQRSWGCLR